MLSGGDCHNGTLNARVEDPIACPQASRSFKTTEDCLVLTVISPDLSPEVPLPVVFWIHGGAFISLSNSVPGYTFTEDEADAVNAVVVNVNYRVGYLGFLQLKELWNEENTYGNYGIQDIITALKWVQNNIIAFGGDPDSVTVAGESAGGTVGFALLSSPLANNFFHRCILLSPRTEMRSSYRDGGEKHKAVDRVAKKFNCEHHVDIIKCLRNAPLKNVTLSTYFNHSSAGYWQFPLSGGVTTETTGMIFTDPITVPLPPHEIKSSPHKPANKIEVILSSTDYENSFNRVKKRDIKISSFEELFDVIKTF